MDYWSLRSSHRTCFVKKFVPKYLANFTGKHLCRSLLKRNSNKGLSCEICKICKIRYFEEHLPTTASDHYTLSLVSLSLNFMIRPYVKFIMICFFILIFFIKLAHAGVSFKTFSRLTIIMCLVFYCKTISRHTVAMPLDQTYCFQKWMDPQLYGAKLKSYFTW